MIAEALVLVERAVTIVERHTPSDGYDLAPYLGNLGFWLCQAQRFREAIPLFRRTLMLLENSGVPPDSLVLALSFDNLGWALTGAGEYDEARAHLMRALAISERNQTDPKGRLSHVAMVVQDLAELEQASGNRAESEALYRRVIGLRERECPDDLALANTLERYASLLKQMGRSLDAVKAEARAKELRRKRAAVVK